MSSIIHISGLLKDEKGNEKNERFVGKATSWDYGDRRAKGLVIENK